MGETIDSQSARWTLGQLTLGDHFSLVIQHMEPHKLGWGAGFAKDLKRSASLVSIVHDDLGCSNYQHSLLNIAIMMQPAVVPAFTTPIIASAIGYHKNTSYTPPEQRTSISLQQLRFKTTILSSQIHHRIPDTVIDLVLTYCLGLLSYRDTFRVSPCHRFYCKYCKLHVICRLLHGDHLY